LICDFSNSNRQSSIKKLFTRCKVKTLLHKTHKIYGTVFTEYQGWELPGTYGDPIEEHTAARRAAGITDVSHRAKLRLTGSDRVEYLHRILSNDVKNLEPGRGCHAAFLTPQGKILADMRVYVAAEKILIEMEPRALAMTLDKLVMYKLTMRVEIEDVTQGSALLSVHGPKSTDLMSAYVREAVSLPSPLQHAEYQVGGIPVRVIRRDETGDVGYELWASATAAETLWGRLLQVGSSFGAATVGFEAFNILRVEAGTPWYGVDMDETNFPQEACLDDALHWQKECYVGQEPVARIKYRGHVNKKLVGLKIEGDDAPEPGDKIFHENRPVGHITSAVRSPYVGGPIALGYVRREVMEPGQALTVQRGDHPARALVVQLPFYP
jgi:glycine cleavage system T protein